MDTRFPDFYLVGAPKSGTTSLHYYFSLHPDIFVPQVKEPHYFACPEVTQTYYETQIVDKEEDYLALYAMQQNEKVAGDCSSSYLFSDHALERIHSKRPDAKILVVLRNPIKRAISHYQMDVRAGYQHQSMMECLKQADKHEKYYQEYVSLGDYLPQLQRLFGLFGQQQAHICLYEELQSNTQECVERMFHFLGVQDTADIDFSEKRNVRMQHRFPIVDKFATSRFWLAAREWVPHALIRGLQALLLSKTEPYDFSAETEWLQAFYAENNTKLESFLGIDLGVWRR